ncbi:hypothetical protein BDV95DRAFT_516925 [Massariosphaeria phaeospora]|uniref:Uncharacterized protein n=1 Tax=Massariosphaeria phaeospora TaxID=100035 RepID=A0A7C8MB05_9PLEO|nr:hypothetical protein BDV95DRAFT_516925 [Massariosphaeria phaeospora]
MAARGPRSSYSSRSVSPETSPEHYDPFNPGPDRIHMSPLSPELRGNYDNFHRTPSPGDTTLRAPPAGSYLPGSRGGDTRYGILPHNESQEALHRTAPDSTHTVSSYSNHKTGDLDAQALAERRAGELAQWKIHWATPLTMIALLLLGAAGAVGHHVFYRRLDGQEAKHQLEMIRWGTALAFFVKSTMVGSVVMSYRQRVWYTVRKRALTIKAIDGFFSATEDFTQFWNWEMIRNGKLAAFMALCGWLIPIASVLAPGALTQELQSKYGDNHCPSVAALNFTREETFNFRNKQNFLGSSLTFLNTTDIKAEKEGWFDYYDQPSKLARRLAITSAYLGKPATHPNASVNACGQGWNCTYVIEFKGPGYKCDEIANNSFPLNEAAPFNLSIIAPQGDNLYYSEVGRGDYKSPQIDSKDGMPIQDPPYPDSLGVFESEPILWVGYATNTTIPYEKGSPQAEKWVNRQEPKMFKCTLYHTVYAFRMSYNDSLQAATRIRRDFLKPIVDTTITPVGDTGEYVAAPAENFVRPGDDAEQYKLVASYHALGVILRNFLRGSIAYTGNYYVTHSDLSETMLINPSTSYPVANLMDRVQSLFEDMLITLLSEPNMVVYERQEVECRKHRTIAVYAYVPEALWIGYAAAVAVTLVFVLIGLFSIYQNGVASDTQFSRIMVTTRNPTIDRLSVGACLGGDPFPKELTRTKLRFGVLLEDDPREGPLGKIEHCCFGVAGETKEIVKHGTYAGLKKWREKAQEEAKEVEEKEPLLEKHGKEL